MKAFILKKVTAGKWDRLVAELQWSTRSLAQWDGTPAKSYLPVAHGSVEGSFVFLGMGKNGTFVSFPYVTPLKRGMNIVTTGPKNADRHWIDAVHPRPACLTGYNVHFTDQSVTVELGKGIWNATHIKEVAQWGAIAKQRILDYWQSSPPSEMEQFIGPYWQRAASMRNFEHSERGMTMHRKYRNYILSIDLSWECNNWTSDRHGYEWYTILRGYVLPTDQVELKMVPPSDEVTAVGSPKLDRRILFASKKTKNLRRLLREVAQKHVVKLHWKADIQAGDSAFEIRIGKVIRETREICDLIDLLEKAMARHTGADAQESHGPYR